MENEYKQSKLYKLTKRCFWILMFVYVPTYFITRFMNENERFGDEFRFLNTLWFLPTHHLTWESYVMTPEQVSAYLNNQKTPKIIMHDSSFSPSNPLGDYYVFFRFKSHFHRVNGALIKCYVKGVEFPLEWEIYPGDKEQYTEYIIPIHVDPEKISSAPQHTIRWRSIYRF